MTGNATATAQTAKDFTSDQQGHFVACLSTFQGQRDYAQRVFEDADSVPSGAHKLRYKARSD
jgi:hypothetical protein